MRIKLSALLILTPLMSPIVAMAEPVTDSAKAECTQATSDYERYDLGCPVDLSVGSGSATTQQ
jgi:hypothetical protein